MAVGMPDWVSFLKKVGALLASLPTAQVGGTSPRVVLSVPTGRFSYWLAAAGALEVEQEVFHDWKPGDRCAGLIDNQMQDLTVVSVDKEKIGLTSNLFLMRDMALLAPIPANTPEGRRAAKIDGRLLDALEKALPRGAARRRWYAQHALKPVVMIGTGRMFVQEQREVLLAEASAWFKPEIAALFHEDAGTVFKASHILFHPFMIFDPAVDKQNPWIREVAPRLTVVTSWSSYKRMNSTLFQLAPQLIVCNRRVGSGVRVFDETKDEPINSLLEDRIRQLGMPPGVFIRVFDAKVTPFDDVADRDDDEFFDEEELL
jgi:hypothetical protein